MCWSPLGIQYIVAALQWEATTLTVPMGASTGVPVEWISLRPSLILSVLHTCPSVFRRTNVNGPSGDPPQEHKGASLPEPGRYPRQAVPEPLLISLFHRCAANCFLPRKIASLCFQGYKCFAKVSQGFLVTRSQSVCTCAVSGTEDKSTLYNFVARGSSSFTSLTWNFAQKLQTRFCSKQHMLSMLSACGSLF